MGKTNKSGAFKNTQLKAKKKPTSGIDVQRLKNLLKKEPAAQLKKINHKNKELCQTIQTASLNSVQAKKVQASSPKKKNEKCSLADDARNRLESARFRYLNEKLYTSKSEHAFSLFKEDPQSFSIYHKGFQNQVAKWPINPLDIIISEIQKQSKDFIIADFGCGEARLSESVSNIVHSFDFVAANQRVTACDMSNVPLANMSVDMVVFCLSLMGTNVSEFLMEGNRVLKNGGTLYIAEVESRCPIDLFTKAIEKFGFKTKQRQDNFKYFYLVKFTKVKNLGSKATLPKVNLKPCLYKKR